MIIATTETIAGKKVKETLGVVKGSIIKARWFGRDIAAQLKNIIGGEIKSYTDLLNQARDEALERMIKQAKQKKADAIVNVRFATSDVMQGSAEILVYGTAVKLK
ncbi:YbjQ family protein [Candidatus Woesearchaeota archaeon]|nr:YbjQ family protein [Candidatus Woesearchaeota archaeon]